MTLRVDPAHPAEARELLEASHALMEELFPSQSNHYLSTDALCADNIRFFVARDGEDVLGCGALALKDDYAEVKSMFTTPNARGRGVADMILSQLTAVATAQGMACMRLETGNTLEAAHRLYERHGFRPRGPYQAVPPVAEGHLLFFEMEL